MGIKWVSNLFQRSRMAADTKGVSHDQIDVKEDLRNCLQAIGDLNHRIFEKSFDTAYMSASEGDLHLLTSVLSDSGELSRPRALEVASALSTRTRSLMSVNRQLQLGITQSVWLNSNAPCMVNPKRPTDRELRRDAAHRAANGQKYELATGLLIDGEWTWPGMVSGCKCAARVVLPA